MADTATLDRARRLLNSVGYDDDLLVEEYPVWSPDLAGVELANLVAFVQPAPRDMSTAVIVVHLAGDEPAHRVARALAAPYVFTPHNGSFHLSIAKPDELEPWRTVDVQSISEMEQWLRPQTAARVKLGLRQLPLFNLPVDFLASARAKTSERLGPMIGRALAWASDMLSVGDADPKAEAARAHRAAARLVVSALTALVIRDREPLGTGIAQTSPPPGDQVIQRAAIKHPTTLGWIRLAPASERRVLDSLIDELGNGINYRSMDPAILSRVYEEALVDENDRRQLGIHYTPPELADCMLAHLPIELIDPGSRDVFDPACGSGSLLIAAHKRLYELQPREWSLDARHQDLRVHISGRDLDPFATEIARLALLLKAQPAGNGWTIETMDSLSPDSPRVSPQIVVMNPPWRFTSDDRRHQLADDFMSWAADELRPGGLLGAILPTSWLSADNSKVTRDRIRAEFEVFEIWRLPEGTFTTSRQAPSVLLARKNGTTGVVGKRIVRQVRKRELNAFLDGEPPLATHVVGDTSTQLSDVIPPPVFGAAVRPVKEVATIRTGQQRRRGVRDRGKGVPFLARFLRCQTLWSGRGPSIVASQLSR